MDIVMLWGWILTCLGVIHDQLAVYFFFPFSLIVQFGPSCEIEYAVYVMTSNCGCILETWVSFFFL